jgi:hypothetical protein
MSLKQLILIVIGATIICWLSWLLVLMEVDPTTAGFLGLSLFYISLFFALLGLFFLIVMLARKYFNKTELEYQIVGASFRQAFFFSLIVIGALFLQSRHFLTWWNIIILVLAIGALEYFFLSYKHQKPTKLESVLPPEGFNPPDF